MTWDDVLGHATAKRLLQAAAKHPAPGYALAGPRGLGKTALAELCARQILGIAPELPLESHPDFLRIARNEGESAVKVEQMRASIEALHQTTAKGGKRVILLEQAERLNEASVNALLKEIEESKTNVFLFIVERLDRLPATLRSRLVCLELQPIPQAPLRAWLETQGIPSEKTHELAQVSRGCPGQALSIWKNVDAWQRRHEQVRVWLTSLAQGSLGIQVAEIERVSRDLDRAGDAIEAWQDWLSHVFILLEPSLFVSTKAYTQWSQGLAWAWKSLGSSLPPRVILEWTASASYNTSDYSPSLLTTSYL